jgi:purine-nucleoside phosphorylase
MTELTDAISLVSSLVHVRPRVGLILGSGLGAVADQIQGAVALPYGRIPGFPLPTVPGHEGALVVGSLEGVGVAAMKGRIHLYEGHPLERIAFPVRLLGALGVGTLVVTNAAGGLNPALEVGTLMVLEDHLNLPGLAGFNPLMAVAGDEDRFVSMADAYDETLRRVVMEAAEEKGIRVTGGVYAMVAGPSYETTAEARFLRQMGADAVGMSTVPEVVVARWLGMRVLGISCITNVLLGAPGHGDGGHGGVLAAAERATGDIAYLLRSVLRYIRAMGADS